MFEKETEEYYYKKVFADTNPKNETELKEKFSQTFKDSAEFEYNKTKEELVKAKELLKKIEKIVYSGENEIKRLSKIVDILAEAEQFLRVVE